MRSFFLFMILLPTLAAAGSIDDYYLSRLAPQYSTAARPNVLAVRPVQAVRSLTGIRHSARRDWNKLEPATQKVLAKVLSRPALTGERSCTPVGGHFTIHYATSGGDAPDATDVNQNNVPDWVEKVAGVFEYVYSVEVNKMGYRPPPTSTYDVYLEDLTSQGAYGFTTDGGTPSRPAVSASSFIEIDKAFTAAMFEHTLSGDYTPEQSLRVTAAHEFHHAIQYGYNYYFDIWYAETTSTWMENEVYDSVSQLYSYLPSYLPLTSTIALNAPEGGNSEYGRWIFNRYLTELEGSRTVVRAFWEKLATLPAPADGSDIPMLPVIDSVLNGEVGNNFFGFAKRLFLRNWTSHLADLGSIQPAVLPAQTFTVSGAVQAPIFTLATPYTFAYYKYLPGTTDGQDLVINFPGLSSSYAVSAFKQSALSTTQEYQYDAGSQSIRIPAFSSDAVVYLLICNDGGNMQAPYVGSFAADNSTTLDGSALDANVLAIPPQTPVATAATSSGGSKSGCFIATAAYGSYLHPKVAELRAFRDDYLLTNAPGRLFVKLYYRVSPPLADLIARHSVLRGATRLLLTPVILAVEHGRAALLMLLVCFACGVPVLGKARGRRAARRGLAV
jgi:hypothetical protein